QPDAAGLEADQEHRVLAVAEAVDDGLAVPGGAVEVRRRDALALETRTDPGEDGRELAEHQGAVPLLGELEQVVDQDVDRGRADAVVRLVDETCVEAELPQPGEGPE